MLCKFLLFCKFSVVFGQNLRGGANVSEGEGQSASRGRPPVDGGKIRGHKYNLKFITSVQVDVSYRYENKLQITTI